MRRVAVIGGGMAGLACAHELSRHGYAVDLFEREGELGGRMRTRCRDHLAFDLGANFFVGAYREVLALARELKLPLLEPGPRDHAVIRHGRPAIAHFDASRGIFRADFLNLWSRLRLLAFLRRLHRQQSMDFFDLSTIPPESNLEDAYSLASRTCGYQVADYLVEGFHATMMFYSARQSAAGLLRALLRMMGDSHFDFGVVHPQGHMQGLADALGARLKAHKHCLVRGLQAQAKGGWVVEWENQTAEYDQVVLATTAGAAQKLIPEQFIHHRKVVENTRYATTINVAFSLPVGVLGSTHCFYVPYQESSLICEFTNEADKGPHATHQGRSLVSVGLHENAATELANRCDASIYSVVKQEFLRLMPDLWSHHVQAHDLQRWREAIPKYDAAHLQRVREFQQLHQGQNGLYLCGDYLNSPWLEGACRSGQAAARQILQCNKAIVGGLC